MPEAIVAIGEEIKVVGRLRFEASGRRQHTHFQYSEDWMASANRFALAPGLPLSPGHHIRSRGNARRSALPECFSDAAPDSWGRGLMTKALGGGLSDFDYLVLSDDFTRQGALRFLDDTLEPLSKLSPPVPRLIELERLRGLTHRYELDPDGAKEETLDLAGITGSLGGARPKANVVDNGELYVAKFTSARDKRPIERVEVATLNLASLCGLRAAVATLELGSSDSPIALIRRFDRIGSARIPYISARTALEWESEEGGWYTDIADVIRQISQSPVQDLQELWKRIIFTIFVSNTDDHLKNHGFVYSGKGRWKLSPAFDINPSPKRHRILETGIMQGGSFDASLEIALDACEFFDLVPEEARRIALEMATTIATNWRQALRQEGCSAADIAYYTEAFEHRESELALAL